MVFKIIINWFCTSLLFTCPLVKLLGLTLKVFPYVNLDSFLKIPRSIYVYHFLKCTMWTNVIFWLNVVSSSLLQLVPQDSKMVINFFKLFNSYAHKHWYNCSGNPEYLITRSSKKNFSSFMYFKILTEIFVGIQFRKIQDCYTIILLIYQFHHFNARITLLNESALL